jgi:predicted Zn-dependent protease
VVVDGPDPVLARFRRLAPAVDFCSLRVMDTRSEEWTVRSGVLEPPQLRRDVGAMITVVEGGGLGYAATADLGEAGLADAIARARAWACHTAASAVVDFRTVPFGDPVGVHEAPVRRPWSDVPVSERIAVLKDACAALQADPRVVDASATLMHVAVETRYATAGGGVVRQRAELMAPDLSVTVFADGKTQRRTLGLRGHCQQGGYEVLDRVGFRAMPAVLLAEALELVMAPDCPAGVMDLLLDPEQMMLQIHESIGHPLELDRILGDERNYAGTSFVTLDMFGTYRYGSPLLDVTFDPTVANEFASYAFDDDGARAERQYLIQGGLLVRPLGGTVSQARSGLAGVANSRAQSWNRPPIDRMANLNIEPGTSTFADLVRSVERGVYMRTNTSWSIDDSRNKFQFGCEWAQLIEDGALTTVVRNPNYRGVSATFWRNLKGVGDASTRQVLGTPYCGKGEPNQVIRVGHASPACLFGDVSVFGGA